MQKLAYEIIGYVSRASPGLTAGRGLKQSLLDDVQFESDASPGLVRICESGLARP